MRTFYNICSKVYTENLLEPLLYTRGSVIKYYEVNILLHLIVQLFLFLEIIYVPGGYITCSLKKSRKGTDES